MACMMEDATLRKMGRAMSHPSGQILAKPISMLVNPFTVSQIGLAFNALKGALADPACKVKALSEVKTGDHIVLRPKKANLVDRMMMGQHAIVQGVNRDKSTILVIHYHSEVFKKKSNSQRLHVKSLVTGKVIKSKIRFNKDFDIYKINHESSYSVQMVLERARERLGEKDFNFFLNNDEHFAYFCKTGTPRSCRNKMYILKMAQFTVKLYCLGQSIYLMLGLNSGVATYFYRRTTRVKTHIKKETAIKAKEMATAGIFYGFLNNWLLIRSMSASSRKVGSKDDVLQNGNELQVAIPVPCPPICRKRRQYPKFKPQPGEDRQKVLELGSQLVVRAVSQTMVKTAAKAGAKQMAKQAMKKGLQSAAKKAGEKMAHHAGKSAFHHVAKGAAVKTAVASASKSSGHGVAGVLRAAARGQGLAIGMGALVSVGFATKDIIRAKKDIKEGAISADEYNNVVTRKVAGATTDIAMGTYGAVMGTMLAGPLGAVVGGFMGSMVGSMVGEEIGEELDKNDMGLKWAAKEGTGQGNMALAKITEVKDTLEMQKEHSDISEHSQKENATELNAIKPESTTSEPDTNEKDLDVFKSEIQEELQPSTHRIDSSTLEASVEQGQNSNPADQEPQVGELFGEYFDSIFNRKKIRENNVEGQEQEGQSYKFAKGLWGSFFGNTEDEDEEEVIAGDQSIDRVGNIKAAIQETTLEVNRILPGEPGSETGNTENECSEPNSLHSEVNAECLPGRLTTKTLEIGDTHDVDQSDSSIDKMESSAVTETNITKAEDDEGVELKNIPHRTNVTEPAPQDQKQTAGFSFFGFNKTTFGKVIGSIIQDIVSGDDYQDTDDDTQGQGGGGDPPLEAVVASKSGSNEESNEARKAVDIEDGKTPGNTIELKASDGKTAEVTGGPGDGNGNDGKSDTYGEEEERQSNEDGQEMKDNDTEGDDSCGDEGVVTSDTDGEDCTNTITVNADVHNIPDDTGLEETVTTHQILKDSEEEMGEKIDKHDGSCSESIGSIDATVTVDTSTKDNDDITMEESATTDGLTRDTTEDGDEEKDSKCSEGSVSRDDTFPVYYPIVDNAVEDITTEALTTTQELSTDVIITIDEDDDEPRTPRIEEAEPKNEETEAEIGESEHKDEEGNSMCSVEEGEPETHYMVDSDHILPINNITDYYSITWSVETEDTGEVIEAGLIEDEMTIRNIIKEFAQTAQHCPLSSPELDCNLNIGGSDQAENTNMLQEGISNESIAMSNSHDSQNKISRHTRQVDIKEKRD